MRPRQTMVPCSHMWSAAFVFLCVFVSAASSLSNIDGIQVDSIRFNQVCATRYACWEIGITYRLSQGHWNSIYIPKTADQSSGYSSSVKNTFEPGSFPCNTHGPGERASTICCLADVMAEYHPLQNSLLRLERTLGEDLETFGATTCLDNTAIPSFGGTTGLALPATEIEGSFLGLTSKIIPKGIVDAELGIYQAVVLLDENELLSSTGMIVNMQEPAQYSVETFIGLIHLKPTGTKNLSPFHQQITLRLEKTNAYVAGTHTPPSTSPFITSVYPSLVEVLQHDDQRSSKRVHYVKVDLTLADSTYKAPTSSESFIPLDSITLSLSHTSSRQQRPCSDSAEPQPDSAAPMGFASASAAGIAQAMQQPCAPKDALCEAPRQLELGETGSDGVGVGVEGAARLTVNVPVDASGLCFNCGARVLVSFEVEAEDAAGTLLRARVSASVSADAQFVVAHCQRPAALHDAQDLKEVARLDLLVGSAPSASGVRGLRALADLAPVSEESWAAPRRVEASSMADAVLTLVVEGEEAFFARNPQAQLVLEDVVTVHFMEPGGSSRVFDQASALASSAPPPESQSASASLSTKAAATSYPSHAVNAAFSVAFDTADNRFHLHPSHLLLDLCPSSPKPSPGALLAHACVTRRDVRYGRPVSRPWPGRSTAFRVEASQTDGSWGEASAFMESMLGEGSAGLGESFGEALWAERRLGERSAGVRQAWWINPGYEWAAASGEQAFFLSQRLLLVALFAIDDGAGRRRALLASMDGVGSQVRGATVQFEASAESMVAAALAAGEERVGRIRVQMALSAREACQSLVELQAVYQARLAELVASVSTGLEAAQVLSLAVDRGQERCAGLSAGPDPGRRRRQLLATAIQGSFSSASVQAEMLLVFEEGAEPTIDMQKLQASQGVLSATSSSLPSGVRVTVDQTLAEDADEKEGGVDEESEPVDMDVESEFRALDEGGGGRSSTTALVAALSTAGVVCVLLVLGFVVWYQSSLRPTSAFAVPRPMTSEVMHAAPRRRRRRQARAAASSEVQGLGDLEGAEENAVDPGRGAVALPFDATAGARSAAYQSKLEVAATTAKGAELSDIWFSTRSEDGRSVGRKSADCEGGSV